MLVATVSRGPSPLPASANRLRPMRPAFGEPQALAIGRDHHAVGIWQIAQQHLRIVEAGIAADQAAAGALLHQIMPPLAWAPTGAAFHRIDAVIGRRRDRQQPRERAAAGGLQPARRGLCRIDRGKPPARDADQETAVRMQCEPAGIILELGDDRTGREIRAAELQHLATGGNEDRAIAGGDDVVDARQRRADRHGGVEPVVRAHRAVERRDRVLAAVAVDDAADVAQQMIEESHYFVTLLLAPQ
ncbi:hypothetical protein [Bradyrhizobium sp. JR3.5]